MKKTLAALVLSLVSGTAAAGGFAPWDARGVSPDAAVDTAAVVTAAGFAPWRDRIVLPDMNDAVVRMSDTQSSAFRPWS